MMFARALGKRKEKAKKRQRFLGFNNAIYIDAFVSTSPKYVTNSFHHAAQEPKLRDNTSLREKSLLPMVRRTFMPLILVFFFYFLFLYLIKMLILYLIKQETVQMLLPAAIGDYTDFFSSMHHAKNCGTIFRGPENPIPPNWYDHGVYINLNDGFTDSRASNWHTDTGT